MGGGEQRGCRLLPASLYPACRDRETELVRQGDMRGIRGSGRGSGFNWAAGGEAAPGGGLGVPAGGEVARVYPAQRKR
jgi:hypothetical protein